MEQHGIKSYFSGCLTLTLGLKYNTERHDDGYFFVDPHYNFLGVEEGFSKKKRLFIYINIVANNYKSLLKLKKRFHVEYTTGFYKYSKSLSDWICCISFYNTYSKIFEDDILINANYITHDLPQSLFKNNDDKMQYARHLIQKYANAKLVVTSRLHCALPCIATGTPTIFINSDKLENGYSRSGSTGRFDGLIDLMNTLYCNKQELYSKDDYLQKILRDKIKTSTIIRNPNKYLNIKSYLTSTVLTWLKQCNENK